MCNVFVTCTLTKSVHMFGTYTPFAVLQGDCIDNFIKPKARESHVLHIPLTYSGTSKVFMHSDHAGTLNYDLTIPERATEYLLMLLLHMLQTRYRRVTVILSSILAISVHVTHVTHVTVLIKNLFFS